MAPEDFLDLDGTIINVSIQDLLLSLSDCFMGVFHGLSQIVELHVKAQLFSQLKESFKVLDVRILSCEVASNEGLDLYNALVLLVGI